MRVSVAIAICVSAFATVASAWNGEAHQVVAWIAEERLSEKAQTAISELLDGASISDAEVASWADEVRRERKETAPWHYVNIPVDAEGFDAKRDGNDGDNIIDAIERLAGVLNDPKAPREERNEALKFLVHFIGDIHQPLHAAERNADKGGNKRLAFFPGRKKALSLHVVWDTYILKESKGTRTVADYGGELNARIEPKQVKVWTKAMPHEWAAESWRLAKEVVYADVPADGDPPTISLEYIERAKPVVDEQIMKAGVRLAELLNRIFTKG